MKTWHTKSGYSITKVLSGRSNAFLVSSGTAHILVDTGPARKWKSLDRNLKKLKIEKIDLLLLTHTHFDHAGNAKQLQDAYLARVAVHEAEKSCLGEGACPLPRGTTPFTRFLVRYLGDRMQARFRYSPCHPDIVIESTHRLEEFGMNAYILPTPGHSAGSVSLVVDDEIALVGDAMFGIFKNSIFPPFADDTTVMTESWKKLLDTGCALFLPAHGRENSRDKVQRLIPD